MQHNPIMLSGQFREMENVICIYCRETVDRHNPECWQAEDGEG